MNMNKFYGGWSPMGQAFKSMQNQRGFEYRESDAIVSIMIRIKLMQYLSYE